LGWDKIRHDIIISGVIFFIIGLFTTIIVFTVLKEYNIDKLLIDIIGIIGFFYWIFSIPTIFFGFLKQEKPKIFLK
jgi:hypothetical protein